ncbi:MAG: efflux RND transporter periplasmic adaptor subunit [Verrucomicrobia bacterium]|nr:efflux RND transporter periplasmic adaptor subunit [Verrucomicrobiota bacterium]
MRWTNWMTATVGLTAGAVLILTLPEQTLFAPHADHASEDAAVTGARYACPMMDFIGNKPGDCPVCGMKMTKVTAGELTREQQRRMGVELVRVSSGPAVATLRAYGTVRYDDRTLQVVVPRVPGRIVRRHPAALHFGTEVSAGAPVVDLYSPEAFAAQGELAAAVKLGDAHTIHALVERFMRWNLAAVAAAIVEGKAPVDTLTLTTPFSGLVVPGPEGGTMDATRLPQVGQEVMADTVLLRLVEPRSFMITLQVPEARAHWLRVGQPAHLASDDRGELPEVTASISWISPELNAELRSREVHLHLQDPARRLLAGSLVQARLAAALGADGNPVDPSLAGAAGTFTLVPKAAVLSTGVRHVAWRVAERLTDGRLRFELVPLALGPRLESEAGQDLLVVRAGLRPGDEVAAQGAFLIDAQAQLAGTASLLFTRGAAAPASGHSH